MGSKLPPLPVESALDNAHDQSSTNNHSVAAVPGYNPGQVSKLEIDVLGRLTDYDEPGRDRHWILLY